MRSMIVPGNSHILVGVAILPCLFLLRSSLCFRDFLGLLFPVQFPNGLTGIVGQPIVRIAAQKILEGARAASKSLKIVLVNLADGEQPIETVLAAGILAAQELILLDGLVQDFVVVETPSHFHQRLGNRHHAGIGFRGSGRSQVNVR